MSHGIKGMITTGVLGSMQGFDRPTELMFICDKDVLDVLIPGKDVTQQTIWTRYCVFLGYHYQCMVRSRLKCFGRGNWVLINYYGKVIAEASYDVEYLFYFGYD